MSKRISNSKAPTKARLHRVRVGWRKRKARAIAQAARQRDRVDGMLAASLPTPPPGMPDGLLGQARRFLRIGGRGR